MKSVIIKSVAVVLTISLVIAIKKMHDMNYQRVLLFYILVINTLSNLELGFHMNTELEN